MDRNSMSSQASLLTGKRLRLGKQAGRLMLAALALACGNALAQTTQRQIRLSRRHQRPFRSSRRPRRRWPRKWRARSRLRSRKAMSR